MSNTKSAVGLIVVAVVGYLGFELVTAWLRHRQLSGGPAGRGEAPVLGPTGRLGADKIAPTGHVGGAAMTGGGQGLAADTGDEDGMSNATRVGRGVVRR